jgi:hypothetical protein
MLDDAELSRLEQQSIGIPLTDSRYEATDFVWALFDTVLDYQNRVETLRKAGDHYRANRWQEIRSLDDLEGVLARFPDTKEGNVELALYLWGNRHWTRAHQLRGLVAYFRERSVTDLESLKRWAAASQPQDFIGHIKGLGPAVYRWLVMRTGVETVKPDVHILRFVSEAVGRPVFENEALEGLEEVARRMKVPARVLDWSIWEFQRGASAVGTGGGGSVSVQPS